MLLLLRNLDPRYFAPTLLVLDAVGPLATTVPPHVTVKTLDAPRLRHGLVRLIRALRQQRPHIILGTLSHINLALLAVRWALPAGTHIIVREANVATDNLRSLGIGSLLRLGYRWLYRGADAVFCPAHAIADDLAASFGTPHEKIHIIYNPVDETSLRATAAPTRRRAGSGPRFVAAGRLTHQKGFDRLLEMFASLTTNACLTIFGEGSGRASLHAACTRLGLSGRVDFPGFVAEPWPYFAGADAFLLPSRWEGMPNAALEALACGTPVIATPEAGGITEVAEAARPGAVTLAAAGAPFVEAMHQVVPAPSSDPRPSLLPPSFELPNVIAEFERTLREVA